MKLALIFPGQGSQAIGMGHDFYKNFTVAKETFQEVDDALNQKLSHLIFEGSPDDLTLTENTQPALMAVSMAIVRVIEQEMGKPLPTLASLMAGHSLGEYTAHCASGTFSLKDTARLLRIRGKAMQDAVPVGKGAMAAILGLDIADVYALAADASDPALDEICVIANDNSPGQVVVSGHKNAVDRAIQLAGERGAKRALLLAVSAPFHSPLMLPAAQVMADALGDVTCRDPRVPIIANVTTQAVEDAAEAKTLLVEQVTGRVRWRESMMGLKACGITHVVEIGAGKVLTGLMKRIDPEITTSAVNVPTDLDGFLRLDFGVMDIKDCMGC
jgi:[acyl-carrier-protein] S-malonyltransferase